MVSLILPPIILVVSLTLLVYFFSRRLPVLEARVRERGAEIVPGSSWWSAVFHNVQHVFWHMLDKAVRKFKLGLLKGHNIFNSLSDSVRHQREVSQEKITLFRKHRNKKDKSPDAQPVQSRWFQSSHKIKKEEIVTQDVSVPSDAHAASPSATEAPSIPRVSEEVVPETLYVRRRKRLVSPEPLLAPPVAGQRTETLVREAPRQRTTRPARMVEETTPEPKQKDQFEEILIERIVSNPRDVEAYERLGDYYLEHENYVDAKECYRQVLKLSPVNRLVKIKIRRLEKILGK